MYMLTVDHFILYCRLADGGGGSRKCPTPCKMGAQIVQEGEMFERKMSGGICGGGKFIPLGER